MSPCYPVYGPRISTDLHRTDTDQKTWRFAESLWALLAKNQYVFLSIDRYVIYCGPVSTILIRRLLRKHTPRSIADEQSLTAHQQLNKSKQVSTVVFCTVDVARYMTLFMIWRRRLEKVATNIRPSKLPSRVSTLNHPQQPLITLGRNLNALPLRSNALSGQSLRSVTMPTRIYLGHRP
jgi:hypothetical protein